MTFNWQPKSKFFHYWTFEFGIFESQVGGGWKVTLLSAKVQIYMISLNSNSNQYWTSDLWIWTFGLDNIDENLIIEMSIV